MRLLQRSLEHDCYCPALERSEGSKQVCQSAARRPQNSKQPSPPSRLARSTVRDRRVLWVSLGELRIRAPWCSSGNFWHGQPLDRLVLLVPR